MPILRVRALLSAGAVILLAAGCASSHFASHPPAGVAIAGDWKLDPAASDHLADALARLGAESARAARARARMERRQEETAGAPSPGSQDVGGPGAGSAAEQAFLASVPAGDYLRLRVSPNGFTVIAGDSSNQYTPGLESVIESTSGEATQISGWKGARYVIDTRPQLGPELIQSFEATPDGRLAMRIRMQGNGIDLTFSQIYVRTSRVAPLAPPTNS